MKYDKYIIKKGKTDLMSSLKALDKKVLKEKMNEYDVSTIEELRDYLLEIFEESLEESKDDVFTQRFFDRLLEHENSMFMSIYEEDIETLNVFVYKNGRFNSYYIPDEYKEIINRLLYEEENINLIYAPNTPIIKDLHAFLSSLDIKDLKFVAKCLMIEKVSTKKRKEIVEIVYSALIDEERIAAVICNFIDKELLMLKDLIANKGIIQNNDLLPDQYDYLYMSCIALISQKNKKFYLSMTDDVYNVIKKMDLDKFDKIVEENTRVYNLLRAMIELYGVVSYEDLYNTYKWYYGHSEDIDMPNNILYYNRMDNIEQIHQNKKLYFIHGILKDEATKNIIADIICRQKNIERKPIELEDLLKYMDYTYYESNEYIVKFKKYLKKLKVSDNAIEQIIIILIRLFRLQSAPVQTCFEFLQEYGLEITDKNMEEIMEFIMNIYNNTRIWSNNGWTPKEMIKNQF